MIQPLCQRSGERGRGSAHSINTPSSPVPPFFYTGIFFSPFFFLVSTAGGGHFVNRVELPDKQRRTAMRTRRMRPCIDRPLRHSERGGERGRGGGEEENAHSINTAFLSLSLWPCPLYYVSSSFLPSSLFRNLFAHGKPYLSYIQLLSNSLSHQERGRGSEKE